LLERAKTRPIYEVESGDVTVTDMIRYLREKFLEIGPEQPVFILRVFEQQRTHRAMIALFLAVLEMVRMQAVLLVQSELFSDIRLRKHKMFDVIFTGPSALSQIEEQYQ